MPPNTALAVLREMSDRLWAFVRGCRVSQSVKHAHTFAQDTECSCFKQPEKLPNMRASSAPRVEHTHTSLGREREFQSAQTHEPLHEKAFTLAENTATAL